jgi:MFS family permease
LVVGFGAMTYPMYALTVAHANDFADQDDFVRIAGGLLLLLGGGMMIGPLLAAVVMESLRPEGLFLFTASVHLVLAAYALYRMSRRERPSERESFRGLTIPKNATPESALLDPRSARPPKDDAGGTQR